MKKFLVFTMAMSALLLTSCAGEDLKGPEADGPVVFSVQLPGDFTRAISDGTTATSLSYAVYLEKTTDVLFTGTTDGAFTDRKAQLSLTLAKGKTYDIIFWADAPNSPYTFDADTQSISVDYTAPLAGNDELRDAFFASKTFTVTGAMTENVELRRPFAQLNFATNDLAAAQAAKFPYGGCTVKVSNVYKSLNLLSGVASDGTELLFEYAALVEGEDVTHPGTTDTGKNYHWLSMNYLLTGAEPGSDIQTAASETIDVEFSACEGDVTATKVVNTIAVSNVPVQRNYRTNIFGALLTSNIDFNIEIKPGYNDPDHNLPQEEWKGNDDVPEAVEGVITLTTPAQLASFAESVANGTSYAGQTVTLGNDIDLGGRLWTPIIGTNGRQFSGTFDGNGKTISNMTVNNNEKAGFFGYIWGTIKNVKFDNAYVQSNHYAGVVLGYCTDHTSTNIENVTVTNSTVIAVPELVNGTYDNGDKAGGIVGYIAVQNAGSAIRNCIVENTTIQGYRDCGAIAGFSDMPLQNNIATDNTIVMDGTNHYKNGDIPNTIGEIRGRGTGGLNNNSTSGNKLIIRNFSDKTTGYSFVAPANGDLTFRNMDIMSLTVRVNNARRLAINGCTFTAAESNPGNNYRFGIYVIGDYNSNNVAFEFVNNTVNSSWSHGLFYQGSQTALGSCVVSGNKFTDWGKKETEDKDIKTSAAMKFYRLDGVTQTQEDRDAFAAKVVDANTYNAMTLETGRVKLNLADNSTGTSIEHTYNSATEIQ